MFDRPTSVRRAPSRPGAYSGPIAKLTRSANRLTPRSRLTRGAGVGGGLPKRERGRRPGRPEPRPLTQVLVGPASKVSPWSPRFRVAPSPFQPWPEDRSNSQVASGGWRTGLPGARFPLGFPPPAPSRRLPRCGHCARAPDLASAPPSAAVNRTPPSGGQPVDNHRKSGVSFVFSAT